MFQQDQAGYSSVSRIRVREVLPDITQGRRPKKRIRDGMQQHVGVGVALEPPRIRDLHSPEDELPVVSEPVDVVAESDAERGGNAGHLISKWVFR